MENPHEGESGKMKNGIFALMFGFAATVLPVAAWANAAGEGYRHGGYMMGGGHMLYGLVMMIAAIAVVIGIVVLVVRWTGGGAGGQSAPAGKSPQDILKERYARGEMTTKEFEERRKALGD
jgi:putative membrane protein